MKKVINEIINRLEKEIEYHEDETGFDDFSYIDPSVAIGVVKEVYKEMSDKSQWIPVSERLPEEKGVYLVAYHPCYWSRINEETVVGTDTFKGKSCWARSKYQKVTHWMPLPQLPKE